MKHSLPAALAAVAMAAAPVPAQPADIEHRVKSAFLFNFAKFVSWPQEKFADPTSPIVLCVPPGDPIAPALAETVDSKTIEARPLAVLEPAHAAAWSACHVAYLGAALDGAAPALPELAAHAILTVHEAGDARPGGVVRLFVRERKLRFEINAAAARDGRLVVSSRLLGLATVVER